MSTVTATLAALDLIAEITADHGPVLFHQSGGCCDGSSPMCYPQGDFRVGERDVKLGEIGGAPFYISASQAEAWAHTDLVIDAGKTLSHPVGNLPDLIGADWQDAGRPL